MNTSNEKSEAVPIALPCAQVEERISVPEALTAISKDGQNLSFFFRNKHESYLKYFMHIYNKTNSLLFLSYLRLFYVCIYIYIYIYIH
jgi:hypothetical protein